MLRQEDCYKFEAILCYVSGQPGLERSWFEKKCICVSKVATRNPFKKKSSGDSVGDIPDCWTSCLL